MSFCRSGPLSGACDGEGRQAGRGRPRRACSQVGRPGWWALVFALLSLSNWVLLSLRFTMPGGSRSPEGGE